MSSVAIIPLFSIACYALLGMIVARERPLTREGRLFLSYLLIIMLWSVGSFMVRANLPTGSTLFWNYFLALWPSLAAIVYYHFVKVFLRKPKHTLWLCVGYFYYLVYVFALAKGYVVEQAYISEGIYHVRFGLGFFILVPVSYCFLGMAIFWLVKEFRITKDPFVCNRTGYLLAGITILLLLTATNFIPSVARYPIDQLGNVINAFLIGYAILKYRLLDINVVLRKGLFHAAITGFIVAVYFVVATLFQVVFHAQSGYAAWIWVLLVAILIAILFPPLYQAIQRRLDRLFDRKKYDYRQTLRSSSQAMASIINLDELISWILDKVSLMIGAEKAGMLLLDSERQQYYLRAYRGYGDLSAGTMRFRHDSPLVKYLSDKNSCLTAEEIDRLPQFRALWKREREELGKLDATVLVPLKAQETLMGILILGSKKSEEPYASDDLDLLSTVANQAATAVRNAQLYEKSRQAYKELEAAQEHLIQSERLKALGEMTSGIAHDFNNILTTILGRAQLAFRQTEDEKEKDNLKVIEQAAVDAAGMVRRLQDFSRVRADHAFAVIHVNQVLNSALEMIKPRLDEACETLHSIIEVVVDLGKISPVEGSAAELREALVNILINAIEAMRHGGKLTVKTEQEGNFAVISISDTGIGMNREVRKRVFEPFFTTKGAQGLGMGLSVVYGIISRHKGQISVSSTPGRGSTFTIRIPISKEKEKEAVSVHSHKSRSNKATVLVVDDNEGSREVLRDLLIEYGHRVDTASSGKGPNPREMWIPVAVPPIISRDPWEAAQERIATNRERLRRRPKYPYLLSGILRCDSCGRAFIGTTSVPNRDHRPKAYHYYRCSDSTRTWKEHHCLECRLRAEEADTLVWDKLAEALRNPQLLIKEYDKQLEAGQDAKLQERLSQIDRELNKLTSKQNRNLDLYTEGEINMPALKKRQEKLRADKAILEREGEALQKILERSKPDMVSVSEFCQLISQGLDAVTFDEKRQILRLLNIEGRVKDGVITLTGCIPNAESCGYSASHQPATR